MKKFELVKNEGRTNEVIICSSHNREKLTQLKAELIKLRTKNRYTVRPELRILNLVYDNRDIIRL